MDNSRMYNSTRRTEQTLTTAELYEISESAGLYYMIIALFPIVLYFDFFLPEVNDAENKYLRNFSRSEFSLLLTMPLVMLLALGAFNLVTFGSFPSYKILTTIIIFIGMLHHPGFVTLKANNEDMIGIRYDVVSKTVRSYYFVCFVSLYPFICGLTGPGTFNFMPTGEVYNFPNQSQPLESDFRFLDKNGEYAAVDFSRGYLTYAIYHIAHESVYFLIMFYLSHLYYAMTCRCAMFYTYYILDTIANVYHWISTK